jgi:hypothetical protein
MERKADMSKSAAVRTSTEGTTVRRFCGEGVKGLDEVACLPRPEMVGPVSPTIVAARTGPISGSQNLNPLSAVDVGGFDLLPEFAPR